MTTHRKPGATTEPDLVRVRLDLAYDGTDFAGFARQVDQRTVQGQLEDALASLCGQAVPLTVAGRTDRGVHATHQVVHGDIPRTVLQRRDEHTIRRALDRLVGPEIAVRRVRRVPASFDARFSAILRRYRYRIGDGVSIDPLRRRDTWHVEGPLDVPAMHAGGQHLCGEHDFSSFCRRRPGHHRVRRIDALAVRRARADLVLVRVEGPAFCHQMVRSITGCLVQVGRGVRAPDWVASVLVARDRSAAGPVAPPHGLALVGVSYASPRPPGAPVDPREAPA